MQLARVVWF